MPFMNGNDLLQTADEYAEWVKARIAAELRARREGLGLRPYALIEPGKVTDETVRNIENLRHSPRITTLALLCRKLGDPVETFVLRALAQRR